MVTRRTDVTDELMASLEEAAQIVAGERAPARVWHPPAAVDVRAIRVQLGLSQVAFARRFGFSPATVREWEQGRRQPEAAARILLLVIARSPALVEQVLAEAGVQAAA